MPNPILDRASEVTQRALLKVIEGYSRQLENPDLKISDLNRITKGLNDAQGRLNKEILGYDGTLAPRTEEESQTGMDTPLVRLADGEIWEKI